MELGGDERLGFYINLQIRFVRHYLRLPMRKHAIRVGATRVGVLCA